MKEKRLQYVEEFIHTNGTVSLEELCQQFQVSKNTIRRDVDKILEKGTIQKVYGGVTSISHNLIPFENRDHTNPSEKMAIGKCAVQFVADNDIIFIDSGTTTRCMMDYLPRLNSLTILTNSLDVISMAAKLDYVSLLTVGNHYKHKTKSFVSDDLHVLDKYNITKAFIAATGVSIANGITNSDLFEYEIKKRVAQKAQEKYLLADISKFGKSTLLTYAQLSEIDGIVTSEPLPEEYRTFCRDHHVNIYVASGMDAKHREER